MVWHRRGLYFGLSGLGVLGGLIPRALPWAGLAPPLWGFGIAPVGLGNHGSWLISAGHCPDARSGALPARSAPRPAPPARSPRRRTRPKREARTSARPGRIRIRPVHWRCR